MDDEVTKLKRLYNQYPRLTYKEIYAEMGKAVNKQISRLLAAGELSPRLRTGSTMVPNRAQFNRLKEYQRARKQGLTWDEIALRNNCGRSTAYQFYKRYASFKDTIE